MKTVNKIYIVIKKALKKCFTKFLCFAGAHVYELDYPPGGSLPDNLFSGWLTPPGTPCIHCGKKYEPKKY